LINNLYKFFIYLSIFFLCIALYKFDYLHIPHIRSNVILLSSFPFLFAGFIGNAFSWKKVLDQANYPVEIKKSIASIGLSIFGKYIPGKIWMIIGRSAYISLKTGYNIKQLSLLSLNTQFITLWAGLLLGFVGLLVLGGDLLWGWTIIVVWLVLTTIIFSHSVHRMVIKIIEYIVKKEITLPQISFMEILTILPWFFAYWIFWSAGFYLLVLSISDTPISIMTGLGFPLSSTIGIIAFFAPGGLGIREGIMVCFLVLSGLPLPQATTIAVTARLWFIIGEIFVFITGWTIDKCSYST